MNAVQSIGDDWIAKLRVEDAKKQLTEHPDRTVYEIALNVGIEDRDNFRHLFRRYVGASPTAYRKNRLDEISDIPTR